MKQLAGISGAAVRGETEFLRRVNNQSLRKEKRIKSIRIRGVHILLIFLLVCCTAYGAVKLGQFLLTWERLRVNRFLLVNKPASAVDQLGEILKQFHVNILTLDVQQLRSRLLTINEVKSVAINRTLPATMEIKFNLRKPVFQVAINGKYNIMDLEGVVLYSSTDNKKELISIRDIRNEDLESLVPYLSELERIRDFIDYVTITRPYGITLKLVGRPEIFYPGDGDFARKINIYLELMKRPLLSKYDVACVDLRFKDRLYFEYREHPEYLQYQDQTRTEASE